jgi:hypothetical protein
MKIMTIMVMIIVKMSNQFTQFLHTRSLYVTRHENYSEVEAKLHAFLTSTLGRGNRSASRSIRFISGKEPPSTLNDRLNGLQNRSKITVTINMHNNNEDNNLQAEQRMKEVVIYKKGVQQKNEV